MHEVVRKKSWAVSWRARLPSVARVAALTILVLGVVFVFGSYYKRRNNKPFRLVSQSPELSTQVTGVIEGIERRQTKDGRLWLLLRAARDVSYSDKHHELEDVYLEFYPEQSDKPDRIKAQKAIVSEEQTHFIFSGDVQMDSHDGLGVRTESIAYDRDREVAETDQVVNFTRGGVTGRGRGARVDAKSKNFELRSEVEITVKPEEQKDAAPARTRPVTIRSSRATFDQNNFQLTFSGGATAEQDQDRFSAETLRAYLNEQRKLRQLEARENSYVRTISGDDGGRATELSSGDMDLFFDENQQLERAAAMRDVRAQSVNAASEMRLTTPQRVDVAYQLTGGNNQQPPRRVLKEATAAGRSLVTLAAPKSRAADPRAANKQLTADRITLFWHASGKDLNHAEAIGNAEVTVEPVVAAPAAERKRLTAPRIDCDFFETDNLARTFVTSGGEAKAVLTPLQPSETRGERTLTAGKMTASFDRATQDVERFDAEGDAKFDELDRHGQAAKIAYTAADAVLRLRGGDPVVWDSRARIKAEEIDADTRRNVSAARSRVATTYYSQEQTGGAAPFAKTKSPVFISSERADFDHREGVATYVGNARAWQDENFVKADRLVLRREAKSMDGEGRVESALYQAKGRDANGARAVVPVFATANRMNYSDAERRLRYEGAADIKQGTDRLTSELADVFLMKTTNEVERTVAERDVVVTQPGKRGTGDWGQYTAADETVILKGEPARVEDQAQGASESRRLTVYLRDGRVVSDDASANQQSTGRVRTTHRVKKLPSQ